MVAGGFGDLLARMFRFIIVFIVVSFSLAVLVLLAKTSLIFVVMSDEVLARYMLTGLTIVLGAAMVLAIAQGAGIFLHRRTR